MLPGDGIGPEVTAEALRVLEAVAKKGGHTFERSEHLMGGCSIDRHGRRSRPRCSPASRRRAQCSSARSAGRSGTIRRRRSGRAGAARAAQGLGVFANLRPVRVHLALVDASPLKADRLAGVDLLVIRELTGGLYFGQPKGRDEKDGHVRAVDTLEYHDYEIRRVVELAFKLARGRRRKVTSVDKANVLESSRLWRQVTTAIGAANPDVALDHMLVDTAAMRLVAAPRRSTSSSPRTCSATSSRTRPPCSPARWACSRRRRSAGRAGPVRADPRVRARHRRAGDREPARHDPVGRDDAPSLLGLEAEAAAIEKAADAAVTEGARTRDLGGSLSTRAMADEVLKRLAIRDVRYRRAVSLGSDRPRGRRDLATVRKNECGTSPHDHPRGGRRRIVRLEELS